MSGRARTLLADVAPWAVALGLIAGAACSDSSDVDVVVARDQADLGATVFPTDQYKGDQVLDRFSEDQIALLPFVRQLRFTAQTGWSPETSLRIPFTPAPNDPDRWLDTTTVPDAIRVYRIDGQTATPEALGDIVYRERSGALILRPKAPWAPGQHAVVIRDGVLRTHGGGAVGRSPDAARIVKEGDAQTDVAFALVAAADPDVEKRDDTLAFFVFTVVDPTAQTALVAAYVNGEAPVDWLGHDTVLGITPILPAATRQLAVGGAQVVAQGDDAVHALLAQGGLGKLPSAAIGSIVEGAIATPDFVSDPVVSLDGLFTNGTFLGRNVQLPFSPTNPLSASATHPSRLLPYLAVFPKVHATPMPVLIAFHGVSRQKEDWLAFANAACATGHALIAIDLYQHGARQADIEVPEGGFTTNVDPVLAQLGGAFPDPFVDPTFLARTRDKIRQSVVDNLALVRLVAAGDGTNPLIDFDGDGQPDSFGPIRVIGQSLGAMVATDVVALSPAIDRAILNVPGGNVIEIVNTSPTLATTLDLLIYATANQQGFGLLAGSPRVMVPDGSEREVYSRVAETIVAAVDPLSYAGSVASGGLGGARPRVLVQLVVDDQVVPNDANIRFVQALAAGVGAGATLPLVGEQLFDVGLPVATVTDPAGLPLAVTEFRGDHGFLLDFVDPTATAAAQQQAAEFLAAP